MTIGHLAIDHPCLPDRRAGRPEAIEELFWTYGPMVGGVIRRLVGRTPDLEDLVQTTFLEALRNIERFRGGAKVSTWLCGIAAHVAHHYIRAGKVRRHTSLEAATEEHRAAAPPALVDASTAEQSVDGRRLASKLHAAVDRMAPKKRTALMLFVMEERSVEEVATLMRATQTATRSRVYFARRALRKAIRRDPALRELAEAFLGVAPK